MKRFVRGVLALLAALVFVTLGLLVVVGLWWTLNIAVPKAKETPTPKVTEVAQATIEPTPAQRALASVDEVASIYDKVAPSVVRIDVITRGRATPLGQVPDGQGTGSGFIIDKEGHILTNNHVVEGAGEIVVTLTDNTKGLAKVLGTDSFNDLAVIKVDLPVDKLRPIELGDSSRVKVGELAIAIGNPFGFQGTVTTGVVSSLGRQVATGTPRGLRNAIQTDAPINPGNSGGPLLDSHGKIIGINAAIETGQTTVRGFIGIGFAVPINAAKRVLPQLIAGEKISYPYLGIEGASIDNLLAEELGLPVKTGILITRVNDGTPAAKAGLRGGNREVQVKGLTGTIMASGDILVKLDGRPFNKVLDISEYLDSNKKVGDTVEVEILRDGRSETVRVTLGAWPEETVPRRQ